ncbi:MAG: phosphonate metabolism protein/1,5-bisphosphokinase (PRPP-forming) PhnN, partial [Pseudomonadota bacterium]
MTRSSIDQGWLFLIAGPSGAGKDSVMAGAVARLRATMPIELVKRVITRPPEPDGERNFEVSEAEFERQRLAG